MAEGDLVGNSVVVDVLGYQEAALEKGAGPYIQRQVCSEEGGTQGHRMQEGQRLQGPFDRPASKEGWQDLKLEEARSCPSLPHHKPPV